MLLFALLLIALLCPSEQRSFNPLEDGLEVQDSAASLQQEEPSSNDVPHPVKVNNWAPHLDVGQISAVAVNAKDQPTIFQRGQVEWNSKSFKEDWTLAEHQVIKEDTILTLDPETGKILESKGGNMFYMPHGLTVDSTGNIYVTDAGLHQVMRIPANDTKADLILGEAFVPGHDETHFCAPTDVAVAETADFFFVADGYCNSRVLKYTKAGKLASIIEGGWIVPHSLALFEESDVLCIANREGQTIDCVRAGLFPTPEAEGYDVTGTKVVTYPNLGRVFAIAAKGYDMLAVSGSPHVVGFTIDTLNNPEDGQAIVDTWVSGEADDIASPHALAISADGDTVYVAEVAEKSKPFKLHKFEVVTQQSKSDL